MDSKFDQDSVSTSSPLSSATRLLDGTSLALNAIVAVMLNTLAYMVLLHVGCCNSYNGMKSCRVLIACNTCIVKSKQVWCTRYYGEFLIHSTVAKNFRNYCHFAGSMCYTTSATVRNNCIIMTRSSRIV